MKIKILLTAIAIALFTPNAFAKCKASREAKTVKVSGNAGCLIKIGDKMVMVNEDKMGLSPPGGLPETIQGKKEWIWQTACRETEEEIFSQRPYRSPHITVKRLLNHFGGKFYLFECAASNKTAKQIASLIPYTGIGGAKGGDHVVTVSLQNPAQAPTKKWRFPKQRATMIKLFQKIR